MDEIRIIPKIWGREEIFVNQKYCGKKLVLKQGFRCSLHFHKKKDETFYIYRGSVLMEVGDRTRVMRQGDIQHIPPKIYHRFTGLVDSEIIEFSTHDDPLDTERIQFSGQANLRKAYDYDGVISENKIIPEPGAPIITGRSFEEIDKVNVEGHPIYFNPVTYSEKNTETEIKWKAEMISKLHIQLFYEDMPEIIVGLRKLCPDCEIVKV